MLNVTQQGTENHQAVLNIEVDTDRLERAMQQAARRMSQRYKIRGFRPGKAPYNIVVQLFGREQVLEAAIDEMGPQVYKEAVEGTDIEPFAPGRIEIVQAEPLVFKALVPLRPEVDPGDYRSVKVTPEEPEVTDEDVDRVLERLQNEQTVWEPVERAAQLDDRITATVHGEVDGERMIDTHDEEFVLNETSFREFPPGVADEVIGMSAGETRTFSLTYPDDAEREALRGKIAEFTVELAGVKERHAPELDDEFAKGVGQGYESLEALEEAIHSDLQNQRLREARSALEERVLDAVIEQAVVKFPPILVASEVENEVQRQSEMMQRMGLTLDTFLRMTNSSIEQFRAGLAPNIERRIGRALLLREVADRENIEAPEGQGEDGRLRAALDWLLETVAGVPKDWPQIETEAEDGAEADDSATDEMDASAEVADDASDDAAPASDEDEPATSPATIS